MISVLILTLNEEANLPHCLHSLPGCDDVAVLDSGSADRTAEIARTVGARWFEHPFTGHGDQRNWALQNIAFRHPWLLILDADERLTPALWREMVQQVANCREDVAAFRLKRRFFWQGVWLRRANLYPTWVVRLVRVGRVTFVNRGHAETQRVEGTIGTLREDLLDENHRGLAAWRERQERYAEDEARLEARSTAVLCCEHLWARDPLVRREAWKQAGRLLPGRGWWFFWYAYGWRGGWLDGRAGWRFCREKAAMQNRIAARAGELHAPQRPPDAAPQVPLPWALRFLQKIEFPHKLGLCERLFQRRLRNRGIGWARTPGGNVWKIDFSIPTHRWIVYGQMDRGLVECLKRRLRPGAVIVDSGANVGQMLVTFVENLDYSRYFAFEPEREAADWLESCLRANALSKVRLIRSALGEADGRVTLVKPVGTHGSQSYIGTGDGQEVPIGRLSDFMAREKVPTVDFWKLDMEGHELAALRGAEALLEAHRVRCLYVELERGSLPRIRDYLGKYGYRCFQLDDRGALTPFIDHGLALTDGFFSFEDQNDDGRPG